MATKPERRSTFSSEEQHWAQRAGSRYHLLPDGLRGNWRAARALCGRIVAQQQITGRAAGLPRRGVCARCYRAMLKRAPLRRAP